MNHLTSTKIIALIVTYNRLEQLKYTIEKSLQFNFDELFIIDNASNDGTETYLQSLTNKNIRISRMTKNLGGAGGFYQGLDIIKNNFKENDNAELNNIWICLFDDDSYPISSKELVIETISPLPSSTGVVAASVYLPTGEICEMNRVGINPFKNGRIFLQSIIKGRAGFHVSDEDYQSLSKEIDTSSFVGCFLRLSTLINSQVMPIKEFFIYGDDVLFTYHITEAGYKNYFIPQIQFVHNCYSYDNHFVYQQLWKVYYLYRNGLNVYKSISKLFFPLIFIRCLSIWYLRSFRYQERRKKYLKIMNLAVKDYLFNNYNRSIDEIRSILNS